MISFVLSMISLVSGYVLFQDAVSKDRSI
jgi:hypothetical protein